ncbi:MAG: nicotinate-nucleotide--dimethylbenzimidazole phosphoribosyltransferase [Desulfobacterales bacterium]|nr:nicotinate-nucleotide--dimethylbenzimidazole phosphoribosyltransferase [Desulfobacterales bacterium]
MDKEMGLKEIIEGIGPLDGEWIEKAKARTVQLIMPTRALGALHDISERICGIRQTLTPSLDQKAFLVMAGDHGVMDEGVSAYPREVTGEMVKAFLHGGAGINALSRHIGADVIVVDMGIAPDLAAEFPDAEDRFRVCKVAPGTKNLARGPAMTREEAETAVRTGFRLASELFERGVDVLGTGDMGIGNTTPSAAIGAVVTGASLDDMVGRGTGVDDEGLSRKKEVVRRGLDANRPNPADGLDVLSKVGGFEIGGVAGCVLAGAYHRRPVVIDGFISTAGALVANLLHPSAVEYIFAGHCSAEAGHRLMLEHLGLEPILNLGMRLGEGTGAALAMGVVEGAVRAFKEVLTFEEAGVTDKE